jgi:hypothetical protein
MNKSSQAWWNKARRARDQLTVQVMSHPGVCMVDIGIDPQGECSTPVLRVHVRQDHADTIKLPSYIEGIPIRVIRGTYELQNNLSQDQPQEKKT